jgi:hypothetical protein
MAKSKDSKVQDKRKPANELLINFMQENKITLIVDEIGSVNTDIKDTLHVVVKRPRIRAFYADQMKKVIDESNNESKKPKIDIVN